MGTLFYLISRPRRAAYELNKGPWSGVLPTELEGAVRGFFHEPTRAVADLHAFFAKHGAVGLEVVSEHDVDLLDDGWMLEGSVHDPPDPEGRALANPRPLNDRRSSVPPPPT